MECASAGLPVIAIVPEAIEFTDLANRFYVEFARIGVLHHTAKSAANFLNGTSIRAWWREVQTMDVFQTFLRTYCNCERHPHYLEMDAIRDSHRNRRSPIVFILALNFIG